MRRMTTVPLQLLAAIVGVVIAHLNSNAVVVQAWTNPANIALVPQTGSTKMVTTSRSARARVSRIPTALSAKKRGKPDNIKIPDKFQITSVNKKEIAWDNKTGRFFETGLESKQQTTTSSSSESESTTGFSNPFANFFPPAATPRNDVPVTTSNKSNPDDVNGKTNPIMNLFGNKDDSDKKKEKVDNAAAAKSFKIDGETLNGIQNPFSSFFTSTETTDSAVSKTATNDKDETSSNPFANLFPSAIKEVVSSELEESEMPSLSKASLSSSTSKTTATGTSFNVQSKFWNWKGYDVYSQVSKPGQQLQVPSLPFLPTKGDAGAGGSGKPAVILIHGFGCSTTYWRATIEYLINDGYEVHAIDLLGQGQSAKPGRDDGITYSINLWAELVDDYIQQNIGGGSGGVVLMGNSLGSVVALSVATGDFAANGNGYVKSNDLTKGLCLFNCGIGMNSQGVIDEPQWNFAQRTLLRALFGILNTLIFGNQPLLTYILGNVVTRDFLRSALENLYLQNPQRVDDELVESFYLPAKQDGAVDALSQIYTNDPGKMPQQIYAENSNFFSKIPIQVVWGDQDPVAPMAGPVGQFFLGLSQDPNSNVSFETVTNCGHVPFDDAPEQSNEAMMKWIDRDVMGKKPLLEGIFGR